MTALKTTRKLQNSSQDLFGNVKIPVLSELKAPISNSWTTVDHSKDVPYSSLLGIPVAGLPTSGNVSFQILSRYWTVQCEDFAYVSDFGENVQYNLSESALVKSQSTFMMQATGKVTPDHATCKQPPRAFQLSILPQIGETLLFQELCKYKNSTLSFRFLPTPPNSKSSLDLSTLTFQTGSQLHLNVR